jgi:hypothetical protein
LGLLVAKGVEQLYQIFGAAVHVADSPYLPHLLEVETVPVVEYE